MCVVSGPPLGDQIEQVTATHFERDIYRRLLVDSGSDPEANVSLRSSLVDPVDLDANHSALLCQVFKRHDSTGGDNAGVGGLLLGSRRRTAGLSRSAQDEGKNYRRDRDRQKPGLGHGQTFE